MANISHTSKVFITKYLIKEPMKSYSLIRRRRKGKWRMEWDSNPRDALTPAGFQDRCLQPLGHPSVVSYAL